MHPISLSNHWFHAPLQGGGCLRQTGGILLGVLQSSHKHYTSFHRMSVDWLGYPASIKIYHLALAILTGILACTLCLPLTLAGLAIRCYYSVPNQRRDPLPPPRSPPHSQQTEPPLNVQQRGNPIQPEQQVITLRSIQIMPPEDIDRVADEPQTYGYYTNTNSFKVILRPTFFETLVRDCRTPSDVLKAALAKSIGLNRDIPVEICEDEEDEKELNSLKKITGTITPLELAFISGSHYFGLAQASAQLSERPMPIIHAAFPFRTAALMEGMLDDLNVQNIVFQILHRISLPIGEEVSNESTRIHGYPFKTTLLISAIASVSNLILDECDLPRFSLLQGIFTQLFCLGADFHQASLPFKIERYVPELENLSGAELYVRERALRRKGIPCTVEIYQTPTLLSTLLSDLFVDTIGRASYTHKIIKEGRGTLNKMRYLQTLQQRNASSAEKTTPLEGMQKVQETVEKLEGNLFFCLQNVESIETPFFFGFLTFHRKFIACLDCLNMPSVLRNLIGEYVVLSHDAVEKYDELHSPDTLLSLFIPQTRPCVIVASYISGENLAVFNDYFSTFGRLTLYTHEFPLLNQYLGATRIID